MHLNVQLLYKIREYESRKRPQQVCQLKKQTNKQKKQLFPLLEKLKGEKILNIEKEIHWPHSSVSIFPKRNTIWFSG